MSDPTKPASDSGPSRDPETGQFVSSDAPAADAPATDAPADDSLLGDEPSLDDEETLDESGAAEEDEAPRPWTSPELSGEVEPPNFEQQGPPEDVAEEDAPPAE